MARRANLTEFTIDPISPAIYPGLRRLARDSRRRRARPFVEPGGPLHWRSTEQAEDGAACGAAGPFTARRQDVRCPRCIRRMVRA